MEKFQIEENPCYETVTSVDQERLNCKKPQKDGSRKIIACMILLFAAVFALLLGIAGACIGFGLELSKLQNDQTSSQQNGMLHQQLSQQNESIHTLHQQLSQQNERLNSSTQLLLSVLEGPVGNFPFYPAVSCAALPPSSPSGYYWVRASNGSAVRVYCDMTLSCGGVTRGWMRVAELDMTNSSQQCPSGLQERIDSGIRTCGRTNDSPGCSSVTFTVPSIYSQMCGKIIGYQIGTPDTFGNSIGRSIDTFYVDGVSLTHGNPRQHIWTFAAGLDEVATIPQFNCPCTHTPTASQATLPPAFVGNDYFCDTGASGHFSGAFQPDDPLWDGAGCGSLNTCCSFNNPPWFYRQLPQHTTDDIEMRLCLDQGGVDEGMVVEMVDIYIL